MTAHDQASPDVKGDVDPTSTREDDALRGSFVQLDELLRGGTERLDATRLLELTVAMIAHADHAAVTLIRRAREPRTLAATGAKPRTVDEIQYRTGEGPCLQASRDPHVVLSGDIATETRWPDFSRACADETGIQSILSVQLPLSDGDHGALNLYAEQPYAFDSTDIATSTVLATFLALVIGHDLHEHDVAHLTTALDSNRQISVAIGVLMARRSLTHDDALKELLRASSHLNLKLREVAAHVEYTGDLPPGAAS